MTDGLRGLSSRWRDAAEQLHDDFVDATPFPMVVLDDFLDAELADALHAEFPAIDRMPRSRDYVFGKKHELSSLEEQGPASAAFAEMVTSDDFARFLSTIHGEELFVDPQFFGGGFHQGGHGSFLDMHVDFNLHPLEHSWVRCLNMLVYMNRNWQAADWGGELLVKAGEDGELVAIEPLFNRAVIMLTDDRTFHGYRAMTLPAGVTRKSIAVYAYKEVAAGSVAERTTSWRPETAGVAKRLLARNYDVLVRTKNRLLGSGTARNR